ncbi:hypothetical protein B9G55_17795 [Saccharibacillus sp. O16]|nr:hypothetical protein B9G55_17795 [Saccharibacillus sp. O16]
MKGNKDGLPENNGGSEMKEKNGKRIWKRGGLTLLAMMLVLAMMPYKQATAETVRKLPLGYNDEVTTIKAEQSGNTLYVPLRETSQKLHLEVTGTTQRVVVSGSKHSVTILPAQQAAIIGQKTSSLKTYTSEGRTMVPASLLKGVFNFGIAYDASVPVLRITSGKQKLSLQSFVDQNRAALSAGVNGGKTEQKPQTQPKPQKPQKPTSSKPIYLTFDDGPTAHTNELLDILDQYGAHGTFFMLGPGISAYPKSVQRLVKEGNAAGLHGMTHVKSKFYASPASALREMTQDNDALYKAAGIKTNLIRTPYGSKPYFTQKYRDKVLTSGFHLWDWNVDSEDWKYPGDHQKVINSILKQVDQQERQGVVPVVLMHDQKATLKVLPQVLKTLKAEGYSFEVIEQNTKPVNFWHDKR